MQPRFFCFLAFAFPITACTTFADRVQPFHVASVSAPDAEHAPQLGPDRVASLPLSSQEEHRTETETDGGETTVSIGGSMSTRTQETNGVSSNSNTVSGHLGLGRFISDHLEFRFDYNGTRNWSSESGSSSTGVSNVNFQLKFWEDRLAKTSLYGGPQIGARFSPGVDSSMQTNLSYGGVIGLNAFLGDDQRDVSAFVETNFVFADEEFADGMGGSTEVSITDITLTIGFIVWI